jgi:hypothetical protein
MLKNEIVDEKENNPVKYQIGSSCCSIPEKLNIDVLPERRVKEIDHYSDFSTCIH